jgi:predicted nucleotidyltransferase component of viral defense system
MKKRILNAAVLFCFGLILIFGGCKDKTSSKQQEVVVYTSLDKVFSEPAGEPLFDGGSVNCLALKELVAEKLRAAATREVIAGRDFYDLGFLLKEGFDFKDKELLAVFRKKLEEDGFPSELKRYGVNLGRGDAEIREMKARAKDELFRS